MSDPLKTYESDTPETYEAVERWKQGKIDIFDEMARLETERNTAREIIDVIERDWKEKCIEADTMRQHYNNATFEIEKLKRERDEARATIESLRDQLCADKCRDKAAADGGWGNI